MPKAPHSAAAVALTTALALALAGCDGGTRHPASEPPATQRPGADGPAAPPAAAFGAPRTLADGLAAQVAPMAASDSGRRLALAWVAADSGASVGTLHVLAEGAGAVEIRDPAGRALADPEAPPKLAYGRGGELYVAYLIAANPAKPWDETGLRVAHSPDGGRHWDAPATIGTEAFGGYRNDHALHVAPDGALVASWLDDRPADVTTVNVYASRSADRGRSWSPPALVDAARACECCRTALTSAPDGTLYVAWRKIYPGSVRDIALARSADGGATWSAPVRVHTDGWVVDACPDAGPAMAVGGDGRVHVAWWTGREGRAGVQYAQSADRGATFSPPVPLGVARFSRAAHVQLGVRDGVVAAAWDDGTLREPRVVARLSRDGGRTFAAAEPLSAPGVRVGYPVVALDARALTVVWPEQAADGAPANAPVTAGRAAGAAGKRVVARSRRL